ncbi:ABC transporter substrate-binding protein [Pelagibacterium lacus]|uniref:ABC transporter substrate-binding protein n=1 Tax=Pelagibacterium lacus TaxID=2282655 RepID=A0A369W4S0_9HYPH|nr:ABC transporter substrate-binding protein [Pelagibacterium lacus]RDE09694.1 ABC transporter substrate-binding protein [Pelagibacterium lacus]
MAAALCLSFPGLAQDIWIGLSAEPSTLDPQARDDGSERAVSDNVYEALMARNAQGELIPGLAAAEPVQVDETTWEFKLREGISFHNGEPFNADAVVYSVNRVIAPEFNSEQLSYYASINGAEAVDEYTVRITTSGADPILPSRMYWMKMVPPAYGEDPQFAAAPVGTGPYKFSGWMRGSEIILEANADYWDGEPEIDLVHYRFIAEPGARLAGLMSGELDVITNLLPEFVDVVPNAVTVEGLETSVIVLSTENPVTGIPEVRQALNIAIDRNSLAENVFGGYAQPARGQLVNPAAFGFNEALEAYPYDPEGARALIESSGAAGQTITLLGQAGRWLKDREQLEAVAAYWQATGLNVNVEIDEWGAYLTRLFDPANRPDAVLAVNSDEVLDADRPLSWAYQMGEGASSNADAELAEWISQARMETDVETRAQLYGEITQHVYDGNYAVPLLNMQDIYGVSGRMEWQPRVDAKLIVKEMSVNE